MGQRRKGKVVSDIKQVKRLANPLGKKYSPPPSPSHHESSYFFSLSVIDDILKRNLYLSKQPKLDDHHLGKKKKNTMISRVLCVW